MRRELIFIQTRFHFHVIYQGYTLECCIKTENPNFGDSELLINEMLISKNYFKNNLFFKKVL
jgi:hypothetical protein